MDMEFINGQMEANTKETGLITKYQGLGNINGMIKEVIEVIGKIIICTVKEFTLGRTGDDMKENI